MKAADVLHLLADARMTAVIIKPWYANNCKTPAPACTQRDLFFFSLPLLLKLPF